ncbi:conserved hypothetical protein [Theileria orientalis strain Shintoku]|uniref:Uncharacterized protein n=1 Tax=Theileria orientalis strain Shintoku TaxID=869250 RepID=J4C3N4_THEOR|nr:conserved hypothetical protein [Theileria orientalis strain Shintoku]BAM40746.1 conserved hypothetical protein [Theileria orientalis strain Shintoku]|eukprot:XP_009691047.1 conserved hypothetical protein [Theileria orientalis strain Shintoku]
MKINTISTYVLVYLLTNGHWNLMVPVKADGGSTGGSDAGSTAGSDAGSTAGSDVAEVSTLGTDGSSASTDPNANANLSSGTDGTVATPANEADGSSSADGASTDADASLASGSSGESADGAASADADGSVAVPAKPAEESPLLNGLYPDLFTSGLYGHKDYSETIPALVAQREEAKLLVEDARKAADELINAALKLYNEARELSAEIEKPDNLDELSAKIVATTAKVNVEMKQADMIAHEHDMLYHSGFPNGWHAEHDPVLEKDALLRKTLMYRDSFPNPWHDMNWSMLDEANKIREKKYKEDKEGMKVKIDGKEAQIVLKEEQIASKNTELLVKKEELEDKNEELNAKKQEVSDMKELIKELQKDLKKLEAEARNIASEHSTLNRELLVLDLEMRKLDDEHAKLNNEFLNLLEDDRKIVKEFYDTTGSIGHLHDKHGKDRYGLYSETDRPVDTRDTFTPYNVDVQGLKHYDPTIPTEVTKAYLGDLYPDMGGSLVIVKKPKELEVHKDVKFNPVDNFSEYPAIIGRGHEAKASESSEVGNDKTKVAAPAPEGSVAPPAVPVSGSTEAKPVEESAEAKAPEDGAKVEEAAPVSTAAPAHTAGHAAVPGAKTEAQAAPAHTAGHAAVPEAKAEAQAAPTGVKFYKTGSDGSMVEMVENTDFEKKNTVGDDRFDFKTNAKCEKITFDGQDVWKKGDQDVNEPRSVTYRDSLKVVVVRDNNWTVNYKKDNREGVWKLESKTQRAARTGSAKTGSTPSTRTGLASPGMARAAGGSTTNLASSRDKLGGSVTNLDTASTTGSDEGKSTGSSDVANLKEVEDDTHVSGSSGLAGATTLRGTGTAAGKTAH